MKFRRNEKGITLVALIITVIILLILAVISIKAVKDGGILNKTQVVKKVYSEAEEAEKIKLAISQAMIDGKGIINREPLEKALTQQFKNDFKITNETNEFFKVKIESSNRIYTVNKNGKIESTVEDWRINEDGSYTKGNQTIKIGDKVNYSIPDGKTYNGEWRILGVEDGQVKLVATANITDKKLNGSDETLGRWDEETSSYKNAEKALDDECLMCLNTDQATGVRSIKVEDIDKITGYDKTNYGKGEIFQYGNKVTYKFENGKIKYKTNSEEYIETTETLFRKPQAGVRENITSAYDVISTAYTYNVYTESNLNDKNSNVYKMLFGVGDQKYWLASSFVYADKGHANFGMRYIINASVSKDVQWYSAGGEGKNEFGVRPVVYLKSNIKLTPTAENSGEWNIEK